MKRIFYLLFTMLCFEGAAQPLSIKERISLSTAKTVSLIFPSHVQSIDRGSDLIIVQKATENIVKVKAVKDSFPETNLTIITADGKLYSLILDFKKDPSILVWNFNDSSSIKTQHPMEVLINRVRQSKNHLPGMKYRSGQVSLQWLGWYIHDQTLFCKIKLTNRSPIGFDMDQLQLYIRDHQLSKRTATQELVQRPLFISGDTGTLKASSSRIWVLVLDKFTLPDDKHFAIEILEKNGGRHLYLRIYHRQLIRAKEL